ncbi:MAG TPA: SPOR domain-containing protein, partial [Bacteroidia bacterium]|nr:SPOR domain-containing protein [Bacteroidia bacterium]
TPTTPAVATKPTVPATTPAKPTTTAPVTPAKPTTPPVTPATMPSTTTTAAKTTTPTVAAGKTYRVQIGAFSTKPKLGDVGEITTIVLDNGVTKYFSGNFNTVEEAAKRKEDVAKKGFPGAFVVTFENGKIVK